jgi:sporulation protein YlmC with PRC-barrel domain
MRKSNFIIALVAGGLTTLATTSLKAQGTEEPLPASSHPQSGQGQISKDTQPAVTPGAASNLKASTILGMAVRNDAGDHLGKVQDLIISFDSRSVPFAIVEYGGAIGIGATHVAVPLSDFKLSLESRQLILAATREQFQSASTSPTGGWMAVAGEDWMKTVDRFYGQPSANQGRFERHEATALTEGREPVRNATEPKTPPDLEQNKPVATPAEPSGLSTTTAPADKYITDKANAVIRQELGQSASDVNVSFKDGVVTLKGKVESEEQKQAIENQIKALAGVNRVQNDLEISSK